MLPKLPINQKKNIAIIIFWITRPSRDIITLVPNLIPIPVNSEIQHYGLYNGQIVTTISDPI